MENVLNLMQQHLSRKRVLVTDGTTGTGRAIAILLAKQGARMVILGQDKSAINQTLEEIRALNHETEAYGLVADEEKDRDKIVRVIESTLGRIDILIRCENAGEHMPKA